MKAGLFLDTAVTRKLSTTSGGKSGGIVSVNTDFPNWHGPNVTVLVSKLVGQSAPEMDKVKVSRAISGLRKKGWVDEIVDCKDNRAKLISLSEQGLLCYSEGSPRARQWDAELLDVLKVGEYKELLCILDKLNSQLSTFLDESSAGR